MLSPVPDTVAEKCIHLEGSCWITVVYTEHCPRHLRCISELNKDPSLEIVLWKEWRLDSTQNE